MMKGLSAINFSNLAYAAPMQAGKAHAKMAHPAPSKSVSLVRSIRDAYVPSPSVSSGSFGYKAPSTKPSQQVAAEDYKASGNTVDTKKQSDELASDLPRAPGRTSTQAGELNHNKKGILTERPSKTNGVEQKEEDPEQSNRLLLENIITQILEANDVTLKEGDFVCFSVSRDGEISIFTTDNGMGETVLLASLSSFSDATDGKRNELYSTLLHQLNNTEVEEGKTLANALFAMFAADFGPHLEQRLEADPNFSLGGFFAHNSETGDNRFLRAEMKLPCPSERTPELEKLDRWRAETHLLGRELPMDAPRRTITISHYFEDTLVSTRTRIEIFDQEREEWVGYHMPKEIFDHSLDAKNPDHYKATVTDADGKVISKFEGGGYEGGGRGSFLIGWNSQFERWDVITIELPSAANTPAL